MAMLEIVTPDPGDAVGVPDNEVGIHPDPDHPFVTVETGETPAPRPAIGSAVAARSHDLPPRSTSPAASVGATRCPPRPPRSSHRRDA